ncbi:MAG TPA: tannase/feruloyl esterase family alpha/beta hydrolase, partial [Alphaproteobacteria bacterium]|nr:tannase/feruloyl esterase family alpha/beta hydrolase [Alphaproteobacteria bacterium]
SVALAIGLIALGFAHGAFAADRCVRLNTFKLGGMAVSVTRAEKMPAGPMPFSPSASPRAPQAPGELPAYCLVEGTINPHKGSDGKDYSIGFAVALPDDWTEQLLFQGGGGTDGTLFPPIGKVDSVTLVGTGGKLGLMRGMAVASTDSGHRAAGFDASFFADQQANLDFQYASIGKVTEVAKALIVAYYKKPLAHSYFAGCSMGGREAMIAAQRYPLEFDGVVSGAPAMRTAFSGIGDRWVSSALTAIAPRDDKGKPISDKALSESDKKLVISKLIDACDDLDGVKDGMIFNVKACKFEPKSLRCKGAKTDACLSKAQVNALDKAFAGPKDSQGRQVYPGFYYDTGIAATGFIPGLLQAATGPAGATPVLTAADVDRDAAAAGSFFANTVGDTNQWTDLGTFSVHGGKLIFFHGVSDPWFSAEDTVDYYKRLGEASGGAEKTSTFARLFLVPGMGHCGGGPGALDNFDMLTPIVDWVEHGKAPESVTATGKAFPGRSRPLCAYPKHAQYEGSGDSNDAANFECRD